MGAAASISEEGNMNEATGEDAARGEGSNIPAVRGVTSSLNVIDDAPGVEEKEVNSIVNDSDYQIEGECIIEAASVSEKHEKPPQLPIVHLPTTDSVSIVPDIPTRNAVILLKEGMWTEHISNTECHTNFCISTRKLLLGIASVAYDYVILDVDEYPMDENGLRGFYRCVRLEKQDHKHSIIIIFSEFAENLRADRAISSIGFDLITTPISFEECLCVQRRRYW